MASSSFTPNLHLCAWSDTDRPKRADFVSDNNIIDTQLGGHISDSDIHVTSSEKSKISEPFVCFGYAGSDEAERTITIGFAPKFAVVFKRGEAPVQYSGGVTVINSAYGCRTSGVTSGLNITGSGIIVHEDASAANGVRVSLNESGSQYTVVAFK